MKRLENKKCSAKWHRRYLEMAKLVAGWSKHPDFQIGAVAVGDFGQILSTGYNGWPRGVVDEERGRELTNQGGYSYSIHAEANLIYNTNLISTSLKGSIIYVYPVFPCIECAKALVQVGVHQVCHWSGGLPDRLRAMEAKWGSSSILAEKLFAEVGVEIIRIHD